MGFGNIGWFQILVVLLIVLLVFGTKKIRGLGGDLGGAIRDFRKGMSEDDSDDKDDSADKAEKDKAADKDDGNKASEDPKASSEVSKKD